MSDPVFLFLANLCIGISAATGMGLLASRLLHRDSTPLRHAVLLGSLMLALSSPVLALAAGRMGWGMFRFPPPHAASSPHAVPRADTRHALATSPPSTPPTAKFLSTFVLCVWAVGAGIRLIPLGRGWVRLAGLRRTLLPPTDPRLGAAAIRAASLLRLSRNPILGISTRIASPLALGLPGPLILFPAALEHALTEAELEGILLHETAHLAHGHHQARLAQQLAGIAFWWHPLVHLLNRRLAEIQEELCDNHVLQVQGNGQHFARCLVGIAEGLQGRQGLAGAPCLLHAKHAFEQRIETLLRKERSPMTRMERPEIVLAGLFTLVSGAAMLGCGMNSRNTPPQSRTTTEAPVVYQVKESEGVRYESPGTTMICIQGKWPRLALVTCRVEENGKPVLFPRVATGYDEPATAWVGKDGAHGMKCSFTVSPPAPSYRVDFRFEKDGTLIGASQFHALSGQPTCLTMRDGETERSFTITVEPAPAP